MAELVLANIDDRVLEELRERAVGHGRTPEEEAKVILSETLRRPDRGAWAPVDAIRERLAATGRHFSDSAELLREDRER
ncbi:MAG: hypothetical protein WD066_09810 [Planctomycetaceae bacterium]